MKCKNCGVEVVEVDLFGDVFLYHHIADDSLPTYCWKAAGNKTFDRSKVAELSDEDKKRAHAAIEGEIEK